jgi:hypothetical protein
MMRTELGIFLAILALGLFARVTFIAVTDPLRVFHHVVAPDVPAYEGAAVSFEDRSALGTSGNVGPGVSTLYARERE